MLKEDSVSKVFAGNDPDFLFWTPEPDDVVLVGPEQRQVPLPQVPIPIHLHQLADGERPADDAIGVSVYDYLRRYPDAEGGYPLADLLRDAFPHYLADIAAQTIMLDEKEVDAGYIKRKITGLKFMALLDPKPHLLYLLGKGYFDLAMMFTELGESRNHLLAASSYLERSLIELPEQPAALNLLGQIDYWMGNYAAAGRLWQRTVALLPAGAARETLAERVGMIARGAVPSTPLIDEMEAFGGTLTLIGHGLYDEALRILEALEEQGRLVREIPMAEFYQLLGYCREQTGDGAAALVAYQQALEIDPDHEASREGFERIGHG